MAPPGQMHSLVFGHRGVGFVDAFAGLDFVAYSGSLSEHSR
jgi:hypothetical protein